jgi:hypothetical protein
MSDQSDSLLQRHGANKCPTIHSIRKERLLLKKDFIVESHNNGIYTSMRETLVRIINRNKDIFESTNRYLKNSNRWYK